MRITWFIVVLTLCGTVLWTYLNDCHLFVELSRPEQTFETNHGCRVSGAKAEKLSVLCRMTEIM